MGLSRRKFTKEFKEAAVMRVEQGASVAEVARSCEVAPEDVRRWRRDMLIYGNKAFLGCGNNRLDDRLVKPRTRSVVFRLTEEEYESLRAAYSASGARSISNFARSKVLSSTGEPSLAQIDKKLDEIRTSVQQLIGRSEGGEVHGCQ
jgi:transposase-like protein